MRRYLIVDDNEAFAENLAEILEDHGAAADVESSGARALEAAARTRYDLLISDMRMPVMGGAELVHRIRRVDPGLPAVVITAYTHDDDLAAARQEGLLAVFPKPAPIAQLVSIAAGARRGGLVALVEDDQDYSDNVCEILRTRGFAAVTAGSLLETERLGQISPCAALVDLRVPGGPDGAAMSRLAAKFPGLPMIVITGLDNPAPPEPAAAVLRKPFAPEDLLGVLARLHASSPHGGVSGSGSR